MATFQKEKKGEQREKKENVKKIIFRNKRGQKLAGILTTPDASIKKEDLAVLFCHGFKADKNSIFYPLLTKNFAQHGVSSLRFDFTGSGESQGDFEKTTITQEIEDVRYAKKALQEKTKIDNIILIGHSLGGLVSLHHAAKDPHFKAIIAIAPPLGYEKERKSTGDTEKWKILGHTPIVTHFSKKIFKLPYSFYEDAIKKDVVKAAKQRTMPFLLVYGTGDQIVGIEEEEAIFKTAAQPKQFITIEDADHNFTQAKAQLALFKAISTFLHELKL